MNKESQKAPQELSPGEAKTELKRLAKEIARHDELYHQKDAPEISDAEYDALVKRNKAIEALFPSLKRTDSPSARVGAEPAAGFAKVKHLHPMLSLNNAFGREDVADFIGSIRRFLGRKDEADIELNVEPKIDGLSANLRYEDGEFTIGATRLWEDLQTELKDSRNAWTMHSDGSYEQLLPDAATDDDARLGSHEVLMRRTRARHES